MIEFNTFKMRNGLQIIAAPMKETKAVTLMALVGTGSRYEEPRLNGISHFLEHMFFKGTLRRPTTLDISHELDSYGASYNAFTSEEETGFYIRIAADHFHEALDILIDILFNSKFDENEVKREKGVILEEINMYQDIPQKYVFDLTKKLLYQDTSLGRPTVGDKNTVSKFARRDFINYREKYYNPNNMVIIVSGCKNHLNWINEIKNYLDKYPLKRKYDYEKVISEQKKPEMLLYKKNTDQAHLTLGFRTFPRRDKRRPILKVLNNLLGETMSSRLFTQVRERRGLAYYIGTDFWDFQDNGAILAYAGIDIKRLDLAIKVILDEFKKLKVEKVKDGELDKAKENLKGRMYLELEDSMSVASFLGEQKLFWNTIDSPEKMLDDIFQVKKEDVQKLAREVFIPNKLNFTMISPYKDKNKINKLLEV